jgi:hypothetical protein
MSNPDFSKIPGLQEDVWNSDMSAQRLETFRLETLQRAENELADSQNRPRCVVSYFEDENHNNKGVFNTDDPGQIQINRSLLQENDPKAALETVAHEGRHAYQFDCIKNPDKHIEATEQIPSWKANMPPEGTYISAARDFDGYWNQPIEVDARTFASSVTESLYESPQSKASTTSSASGPIDSDKWAKDQMADYEDLKSYQPATEAKTMAQGAEPAPAATANVTETPMTAGDRWMQEQMADFEDLKTYQPTQDPDAQSRGRSR